MAKDILTLSELKIRLKRSEQEFTFLEKAYENKTKGEIYQRKYINCQNNIRYYRNAIQHSGITGNIVQVTYQVDFSNMVEDENETKGVKVIKKAYYINILPLDARELVIRKVPGASNVIVKEIKLGI